MCLCSFIKINAQPKSGDAIVPYGIDTDSMTVIDRGFLRVKYAFNADEIDDPKTYIDLQCLEVGNRISKYYSMLAFKRDSLQTEWRKKHPKANIPHFYSDSKRAYHWSEYQYSEIYKGHNLLKVYSRMPRNLKKYDSKHTETLPLQKWTLHQDSMKISGHWCNKATCEFRGRKYIAWYSKYIPVKWGPWKFGGLPGLILSISDTKGMYKIECVEIEFFDFPIKQFNCFSRYSDIERMELLKLQRSINEDYLKVCKARSMKTNEYLSNYTPYHPMELN